MKRVGLLIIIICVISTAFACGIVSSDYLAESALIPTRFPAMEVEVTPFSSMQAPNSTPAAVEPSDAMEKEAISSPLVSVQTSADVESIEDKETQEVGYFYSFLTEQQKQYYRDIRTAFDNTLTQYTLCVGSRYDFDVAFYSLRLDYAQYGWLGIMPYNYSFFDQQNETYVRFELVDDQYANKMAFLENEANSIISLLPDNASEYDTIKLFYDWLGHNITYERLDTEQLLYSAFKERKTICGGYSVAFQYLCNKVGIQCVLVDGMSDNGQTPPEGHTWNMVNINGKFYWVDATWGDAGDEISYYYLCTTDEFLFPTHYEVYPFTFGAGNRTYIVEREACSDETLLYAKQFGLFFDTYDDDNIRNEIIDFLQEGKGNDIVIQFRIHGDVTRFIDEVLPSLLQMIQENGLNEIHSYRTLYYPRDGYIDICFE